MSQFIKIFGNKTAIKRKSLANLDGSKLTEINRLLTEQTPPINRLTDRPKFSRIPNPSLQEHGSSLEGKPWGKGNRNEPKLSSFQRAPDKLFLLEETQDGNLLFFFFEPGFVMFQHLSKVFFVLLPVYVGKFFLCVLG